MEKKRNNHNNNNLPFLTLVFSCPANDERIVVYVCAWLKRKRLYTPCTGRCLKKKKTKKKKEEEKIHTRTRTNSRHEQCIAKSWVNFFSSSLPFCVCITWCLCRRARDVHDRVANRLLRTRPTDRAYDTGNTVRIIAPIGRAWGVQAWWAWDGFLFASHTRQSTRREIRADKGARCKCGQTRVDREGSSRWRTWFLAWSSLGRAIDAYHSGARRNQKSAFHACVHLMTPSTRPCVGEPVWPIRVVSRLQP
jgi:hypothetical protein